MNTTAPAPASVTIAGSAGALATLPAHADLKQIRACHKALMQYAGEACLADGKVSPDAVYAVGCALALIGCADNQTEALTRIAARMGAKPTAAQKTRLAYWQGAAASGKAAWRKGAESLDVMAVIGHADVAAMAPAAISELKKREAAEKAAALEEAKQKKRVAAVNEAAAKNVAALIDAATMAAYRDAMAHGSHMDNSYAWQYAKEKEEAYRLLAEKKKEAAKEAAERAANLEKMAATRAADVLVNRAVAASEFEQLAAALGIKLSPAQIKALQAEKQAALAA